MEETGGRSKWRVFITYLPLIENLDLLNSKMAKAL